jgi:hypothetical protein
MKVIYSGVTCMQSKLFMFTVEHCFKCHSYDAYYQIAQFHDSIYGAHGE